MKQNADLELSLYRYDAPSYAVEFRFSLPDNKVEIRLSQGQPSLAQFELEPLRAICADPAACGKALSQGLFADPAVKSAFEQARSAVHSQDYPLRVRLLIGPSAPELHGLPWELLNDPQRGYVIIIIENLLFSRYLSSLDWQPVRLWPKSDLRAQVVVANPSNLDEYDLALVDVQSEGTRLYTGEYD
jgi:hypothetical protein